MTDWIWCGYPHHFVGAHKCHFSLATFVAGGRFLISTVGDWRPTDDETTEPLGIDGHTYETMVFATNPEDLIDGEPNLVSWSELRCLGALTPASASEQHLLMCHEYSEVDA